MTMMEMMDMTEMELEMPWFVITPVHEELHLDALHVFPTTVEVEVQSGH